MANWKLKINYKIQKQNLDLLPGKKEGKLWDLQPVIATEGREADMTYTEAIGIASSKNSLKKTILYLWLTNFPLQPHCFTTTT